ncbi:hypothetical protein [Streptomyces sp. NPDC090994]|uniref:hypothetical protein n=1 Tax=Streptomyces sp. NPDC090994 TaxID=3365969 RepID=UPI0037F8AC2C
MYEGREVGPEDLLEVAGDEERARSLYRTLRDLRSSPDPRLREMAAGVLRGDLTAREAFTDPEYTAALFSGAAEVRRAGELRSAAEAREAGERFDGWQRERRADDEDTAQDPPPQAAPAYPLPRRQAGPGRDPRPGGPGGLRPTGPPRHR